MDGLTSDVSGRVVVTGMAGSTCFGLGVRQFFSALEKGFAVNPSTDRIPGQQPQAFRRFPDLADPSPPIGREIRPDDRLSRQLLAAVRQDLRMQLGTLDPSERANTGVVIANWSGNFRSYVQFYAAARTRGPGGVNPVHFPPTLLNYPTAQLHAEFGLTGSSATISSGRASGLDAIEYALMRLRSGEDERIVAGGIEEINDLNMGVLECSEILTRSDHADRVCPERHCSVPGEAVGVLLLEILSSARRSGRAVLGEVLGCATSQAHANRGAEHRQQTAVMPIHQVMEMAVMKPTDVEAIFPSASGCPTEDALEADVLKQVFGISLASIPVYPIKSLIGECFAAAGPLQCIAAIYALRPSDEPEVVEILPAATDRNGLVRHAKIRRCSNALIYSFGRDQRYGAALIGRYQERRPERAPA